MVTNEINFENFTKVCIVAFEVGTQRQQYAYLCTKIEFVNHLFWLSETQMVISVQQSINLFTTI